MKEPFEPIEERLLVLLRAEAEDPFVSSAMAERIRSSVYVQLGLLSDPLPDATHDPTSDPTADLPHRSTNDLADGAHHELSHAVPSSAASAVAAGTTANSAATSVVSTTASAFFGAPLASTAGILTLLATFGVGTVVGVAVGPAVQSVVFPESERPSSSPEDAHSPASPKLVPPPQHQPPPSAQPPSVQPQPSAQPPSSSQTVTARNGRTGKGDAKQPSAKEPASNSLALEHNETFRSSLAAEQILLERARVAFARGLPADALIALRQHEREFPNSSLAAERAGLEVLALEASGARDAAKEAAKDYLARYPEGMMADAVQEVLNRR